MICFLSKKRHYLKCKNTLLDSFFTSKFATHFHSKFKFGSSGPTQCAAGIVKGKVEKCLKIVQFSCLEQHGADRNICMQWNGTFKTGFVTNFRSLVLVGLKCDAWLRSLYLGLFPHGQRLLTLPRQVSKQVYPSTLLNLSIKTCRLQVLNF